MSPATARSGRSPRAATGSARMIAAQARRRAPAASTGMSPAATIETDSHAEDQAEGIVHIGLGIGLEEIAGADLGGEEGAEAGAGDRKARGAHHEPGGQQRQDQEDGQGFESLECAAERRPGRHRRR